MIKSSEIRREIIFHILQEEKNTHLKITINVKLFLILNKSKNHSTRHEMVEGVNCVFDFISIFVFKRWNDYVSIRNLFRHEKKQHFDKKTQNVCVDFNGD